MRKQTGLLWLPGMDPNAPLVPADAPPTLEDWFENVYVKQMIATGRSRDRINELRLAIQRWKWWCKSEQRIHHPLLSDVTPRRLSEFREAALGAEIPGEKRVSRPISARSLNKTLGALEQIINAASETLDSLSVIRVKKVAQPRQVDKLVISDSDLSRIFEACEVATWPSCAADGREPVSSPPTLWRFLVAWWTNYGMRTQDLVAFESSQRPICWANVTTSPENPHHDGTLSNEHGWLVYVPDKTERDKPDPLVLPLNATTRHWLDRLADDTPTGRDPARVIAPVPHSGREFYGQWRRILKAADVRPKPKMAIDANGRPRMVERHYKIKHLRCTAATRIEDHAGPLGYPGAGQLVTGHDSDRSPGKTKSNVFGRHYYSAERALIEVLTTLPQPAGFAPDTPPPVDATKNTDRPRLRVVG